MITLQALTMSGGPIIHSHTREICIKHTTTRIRWAWHHTYTIGTHWHIYVCVYTVYRSHIGIHRIHCECAHALFQSIARSWFKYPNEMRLCNRKWVLHILFVFIFICIPGRDHECERMCTRSISLVPKRRRGLCTRNTHGTIDDKNVIYFMQ